MPTPYTVSRTVGPSGEPVSLAEAKDHCEIPSDDDSHNTKLTRFIAGARELVEYTTDFVLMTQTYTVTMDSFRPNIYIPIKPISSVSGITYYDGDNSQQTVTSTIYGLDATRQLVYLDYNQNWPTITQRRNGIVITLVAGFGDATACPRILKQAILVKVGEWFVHRGEERLMPTHGQGFQRLINEFLRVSYP